MTVRKILFWLLLVLDRLLLWVENMTNAYYNQTGNPTSATLGRAATIRSEFAAVEDGFDAVETAMNLKAPLAAPTFTGLVTANGGQVKFPSTQSPSSNANTLDDYEEGTFLPTVYGDSTAGVGTYLRQAGSYTKIGRLVAFNLIIETSAHTGTGNIMIGGLPFSIDAGDIYPAFASLAYSLTLTAGNVSMLIQGVPGTATGVLTQTPTGSTNPVSVPMDQTVLLAISGTYMST